MEKGFTNMIDKIGLNFKKTLPDTPYGPKIASITNAGIEFYWKKVEIASGYEVFRSYSEDSGFTKIAEINTRAKGEYIDSTFDRSKKIIYYKSRSYLDTEDGNRVYSDTTNAAAAIYREEMKLERDVTFMYDGTSRLLRAFQGWGEVADAEWKSTDESIATMGSDGMIHAHATGEAILACHSRELGKLAATLVVVNRKSMAPLATGSRRYSYNTSTKCWENSAARKTNDAVIMMVGDMMCGATQTKKQYTKDNGWSFNDSYEFVKATTALSDLAIGNLETLMAPGWPYMIDESYIANKNNCNNPSRYLDAVLYGGFDCVTMSNNHNCDGGTRALMETMDEVELRNIPYTGVFRGTEDPRYVIIDVNGIKVGLLAYMSKSTGFNGKDSDWSREEKDALLNIFSKNKATQDIAACKAAGAEYVIAYMHWGKKNYKSVTNAQVSEAQDVADAGADYIVGANPHMVQIYDEISASDGRRVPCFYSTGNFHAFMNQIPGNRDSIMVRIRLKRNQQGQVILAENNYIPYHTFKEKDGCYLVPLATSKKFDKHIKVPGRSKYFDRIKDVVGSKVEAL